MVIKRINKYLGTSPCPTQAACSLNIELYLLSKQSPNTKDCVSIGLAAEDETKVHFDRGEIYFSDNELRVVNGPKYSI